MITIKDIADKCGVSIATVSRAFSSNSIISPHTKEKILKTAEELGYRPNLMARGLKNSKTQTVGIIIPSIDNYFYLDVLKHLELNLHKFSYRLLINFIQHNGYNEADALCAMEDSQTDALIFSPRNTQNSEIVNRLKNKTNLLQLFTAPYKDISSVVTNDVYGVKKATEYLISNGYSRILYVGGDERVKGYFNALSNAGIIADNDLVLLNWENSPEIIKEKIISKKADAVIGIARQAETVWHALSRLYKDNHLNIPFIAYDDVNWVKMLDISAVAHPLDKIAEYIVEYIISRNKNNSEKLYKKIVKPFLIKRSSTNFSN